MKPISLSKHKNIQNELADPYYLTFMNSVYIGEWVFDTKLKMNIPRGIGRLYTD
jgi:hypothetical protein